MTPEQWQSLPPCVTCRTEETEIWVSPPADDQTAMVRGHGQWFGPTCFVMTLAEPLTAHARARLTAALTTRIGDARLIGPSDGWCSIGCLCRWLAEEPGHLFITLPAALGAGGVWPPGPPPRRRR